MSHRSRLHAVRRAAVVALALSLVAVASAQATAGPGMNRPNNPSAAPPAATGYGKGWVAVSGQSNGPIQGYLFYSDSDNGGAADSVAIWNPAENFPVGFAYGKYNGCARVYGRTALYWFDRRLAPATQCALPGEQYTHLTRPTREQVLYCTSDQLHRLCTPRGARDDGDSVPVTVQANCPTFANVGAQMFTGRAATAIPRNLLPRPAVAMRAVVRYITKDGRWALAKFPLGAFTNYPDLRWAFAPTACGF